MDENFSHRQAGGTSITGLSALGAVVVLSLAGLVGCKSSPTRVAKFHDPFLPTMLAKESPPGEAATVRQASAQQASSLAESGDLAQQDGQVQLTGY